MRDRPRSVPVEKDQVVDVDVESFGDGPDGLCRIAGYVMFVAEALPGERVRVRVTSAARKFGRGELLEVLKPSPARIPPRCPHFGPCGGCQLQHVAHEVQIAAKADRLRRTLAHAVGRSPDAIVVRPSRAPEDPWAQRNKLALHFFEDGGELQAGYFARRSRHLVAIEVCPVQDPLGLRVGLAARDGARTARLPAWDPRTGRGLLRAVVVRASRGLRQAHATLVVAEDVRIGRFGPVIDALRAAGATGAGISVNDGPRERLMGDEVRPVFGLQHVEDEVAGRRHRVTAGAFFQTSEFGAGALVEIVTDALRDAPADARIVDLYCGGGLFALALAPRVARVFGIEDDERAIADAEATAAAAGIGNATFRAGRVEHLLANVARQREKPFAVVLDPPRTGCDGRVIAGVANRLQPRRIVYVSCDPDSLGRDVAAFERAGYVLREVTPVDMFPQTASIEAVAILDRVTRRRDPAKERLLARVRAEPPPY